MAFIAQIGIAFMAVLIILQIKKLGKLVKAPLECKVKTYNAHDAFLAQQTSVAVRISKAKKDNPFIQEEEIQAMLSRPQLADEMVCFCKQFTQGGFYFWKNFMTNWSEIDPDGQDEFNYCLLQNAVSLF